MVEGEQPSILWQTLILTATEAAPSLKITIMGFWNLAVARQPPGRAHNQDAWHHKREGSVKRSRFLIYAGLPIGVAIVFAHIAIRYPTATNQRHVAQNPRLGAGRDAWSGEVSSQRSKPTKSGCPLSVDCGGRASLHETGLRLDGLEKLATESDLLSTRSLLC
jgi:hypothetical protein